MKNVWISLGAGWAALAVGMGAFGAHGLRSIVVDAEPLEWWHTAASYQLWHALGLLAYGLYTRQEPDFRPAPKWIGWALFVGSVIFSGTLYALALGAPNWLGAVTPIGGSALIAAWLGFAWSAWPRR